MNELTIEDLRQKIARVDQDLIELQAQGDASRRMEVLQEYRRYLLDEMQMLKDEQRKQ